MKGQTTEERFWSKVNKTDNCWEWIGCLNSWGYGKFWYDKKLELAHRASWMMNYTPIPKGLLVCHKCDNTKCIRPDHLFLGTNKDNMRDVIIKGRWKGEGHQHAKLNNSKVLAIRNLYNLGYSKKELAKKFEISTSQIYRIIKKINWSHI